MSKKSIYLFLALLLPGMIFIFLKRCGKNEFSIPVYYQRQADSLNALCHTTYSNPYTVPDSVLQKTGWNGASATLLVFGRTEKDDKELNRIADSFSDTEYKIIIMNSRAGGEAVHQRWTSCVFFVAPPKSIVLIDGQKRIRGYYSGGSREEIDRLILEMKILLKKYG